MSTQVGIRIDREGFDHPIMCCEQAKEQFDSIERVLRALEVLKDHFDPKFYKVVGRWLPQLNYCPTCGEKL